MNDGAVLDIKDIRVSYGQVDVLKGVNLTVGKGEILAVLGANGAGKSTLMNVLSGKIPFYQGSITLAGQPLHLQTPTQAMEAGIEMVQQELGLLPDLTAMENILLGREEARAGIINLKASYERAYKAISSLTSDIPLDVPVADLSPSRQQLVALARALLQEPKLLILDEPTSMITDKDVAQLFEVLRRLRRQGVSILFITHKFNEVYDFADRAVVLRDGVVTGSAAAGELDDEKIITWMVGKTPSQYHQQIEGEGHSFDQASPPVLVVENLAGASTPEFSLEVHKGEIVGLIGLVGSGRSEILRLIAGVDQALRGRISIDGEPVETVNVDAMMMRGVLLLPEDRKSQGLFLDQSLGFNALIYNLPRYSHLGVLSGNAEALAFADAQNLNRTNVDQHWREARTLSGGNQQRLMLGKTLLRGSKVLLLDELSAGVDITTRNDSLRRVQEFARQGMGILFASSHWEEVTDIADRLCVVANGTVVGQFKRGEAEHADFMRLIVQATEGQDAKEFG